MIFDVKPNCFVSGTLHLTCQVPHAREVLQVVNILHGAWGKKPRCPHCEYVHRDHRSCSQEMGTIFMETHRLRYETMKLRKLENN